MEDVSKVNDCNMMRELKFSGDLNTDCIMVGEIKPNYYHKGISPFEYIRANKMDFFEGNVVKYVTRYKEKNGLEDLIKARTYLDEIIKNYKDE